MAKAFSPQFAKRKSYDEPVEGGGFKSALATTQSMDFRYIVRDNSSPTSFLVDTLLAPESKAREMDYVATIMLE